MLLSILAVIIVLSPIVIVHEFGHFIACRLTGIGVKEFSFGFGKILWHKKSARGTDFQLRAIPFGGFVEPKGQMFVEDGAKEPPHADEFAAKKWYAKFFMVVNGALFNYLLAAVIFSVLIYIKGMPQTDPVQLAPVVGEAVQGYPAQKAGLQAGDRITAIDGVPVANWKELTEALQKRQGDLKLTVLRDGQTRPFTAAAADFSADKPHLLGIAVQAQFTPVSPWAAAGLGVYQCWYWTKFSLQSLWQSVTHKKAPDLAGPIGIVNIIHKSVHRGLLDFVFLIAMLSLAVGMFNLFPIPILDGGYALVYLWEGLTGKLPSTKAILRAANVGFYLLMILVLYASYADIKRIFFKPKAAAVQTRADAPEAPAPAQEGK